LKSTAQIGRVFQGAFLAGGGRGGGEEGGGKMVPKGGGAPGDFPGKKIEMRPEGNKKAKLLLRKEKNTKGV